MAEEELGALGALVWCGFCVLMLYVWMHTGGYVIRWLASHIPNVSVGLPLVGSTSLFGWLINALNGFDTAVQNDFYAYLDATKAVWNLWASQVASFVANVTADVDWIANETGKALHVLRRSTIPALILGTLAPGSQLLAWLVAHVAALVKAGIHVVEVPPKVLKQTITRVEQLPGQTTRIITRELPASIAAAIAGTLPRIRGLERDVSGLEKWAKSHTDALGLGVIVGAVGYALSKLGLGSQRCSNVQKYNKNLCGMHPDLLESLLADTLLVLGTVSLVEFAQGMQGLMGEVTPTVRTFWRAG